VDDIIRICIELTSLPPDSDWISCSERLPSVEVDGNKVLIYRDMNEGQELMRYSVHDTLMVKYCEKGTFWMPLPNALKQ